MDGSGEPLGFPVPGQEPLELVGLGPARDHPLEHVGQPRPRLDPVELRGRHKATFRLDVPSVANAFDPNLLTDFTCPEAL